MATDNRIVPRFSPEISMGKPSVARLLDKSDQSDQELVRNHRHAVAAQISTHDRTQRVRILSGMLATNAIQTVNAMTKLARTATEHMDDTNAIEATGIDHIQQIFAAVAEGMANLVKAQVETLVAEAGSDIRDGVTLSPMTARVEEAEEELDTTSPYFGATVLPSYGARLIPSKTANGGTHFRIKE